MTGLDNWTFEVLWRPPTCYSSCPTELWPLRVSAHFLSPCKLAQPVLWSGVALGVLLGSLGLLLLVSPPRAWSAMYLV